jgi:hypothetical protein
MWSSKIDRSTSIILATSTRLASTLVIRLSKRCGPHAEIHFKRLAVTPEQIAAWNLPSRPTKQSDSRAKGFGGISVEFDAIDPNRLRAIVEEAIERHLPPHEYRVLMAAEESERRAIHAFVGEGSRLKSMPTNSRYSRKWSSRRFPLAMAQHRTLANASFRFPPMRRPGRRLTSRWASHPRTGNIGALRANRFF